MRSNMKRWLVGVLTVLMAVALTNVAEAKGKKAGKAGATALKGKLVAVEKGSITVKPHKKHAANKGKPGKAAKAGKAKKAGKKGKGNKKKGGVTVKTTKKTKVKVNGAKSTLAGLSAGMKVKVKEAGGVAKSIKARTGKKAGKKGTTTTTTTGKTPANPADKSATATPAKKHKKGKN